MSLLERDTVWCSQRRYGTRASRMRSVRLAMLLIASCLIHQSGSSNVIVRVSVNAPVPLRPDAFSCGCFSRRLRDRPKRVRLVCQSAGAWTELIRTRCTRRTGNGARRSHDPPCLPLSVGRNVHADQHKFAGFSVLPARNGLILENSSPGCRARRRPSSAIPVRHALCIRVCK